LDEIVAYFHDMLFEGVNLFDCDFTMKFVKCGLEIFELSLQLDDVLVVVEEFEHT
jgi:hypothetical protein